MTTHDAGSDRSAARRRGSEAELDGWLAFALATADLADSMVLARYRRDLVVSAKPDRSFVTDADQAIEAAIRDRIAAALPGHGVVGEEYGADRADSSLCWYIDPIDGTHNFMRGVPLFGTLLGLERDGEMQVGVISAPAIGHRWYARRGGGAWADHALDGTSRMPRRIHVSQVASLGDAQLLYASTQDIRRSGKAPGFPDLQAEVWRERAFGDLWGYGLVAEGGGDAMVEADLSSWDMAGPQVVVEEAGGRMTDLSGERTIHGGSALATNGILHDEILRRLHATGD